MKRGPAKIVPPVVAAVVVVAVTAEVGAVAVVAAAVIAIASSLFVFCQTAVGIFQRRFFRFGSQARPKGIFPG